MPSDYNDTGIATGAIANIQNGADSVPVKSWEIEVAPTFSGVSSVVCTQMGKNIMPPTSDSNYWEEGNINASGANQSGSTFKRTIGYISVKGFTNALLCLSGYTNTGTSDRFRIFRYDKNFNFISYANLTQGKYYINDEVYYIRMRYDTTEITWSNEQLEYIASVDDSPTSYEPYSAPVTNTVSLGRTIYGGEADVVNGTGKEEYVLVTFDGSDDEGWAKTNAGPYYTTITGYYKEQGFVNGICDSFTMVAEVGLASNMTTDLTCSFYFGNDQNRFYIRYDAMANVSALKAWLSENPVTVVYKVATATAFTFTPITPTPETELGTNNFYGDTGDSEVTYYKSGYGYTSVTVNQKDSSDTLIDTKTIKFHRIIYEGSVDVIRGIGTISVGESGTEYDPPESLNFSPISMSTIEGEQTLYSDEGNSAITYRKGVE